MSHSHHADIDSIRAIPNPEEKVPEVAKPTLALFVVSVSAWIASSALALTDSWPWPLTIVVNTIAAFALFTVSHDASHNSLSTHSWVNLWIGRICMVTLSPLMGFRAFRFIHMQHHRFTNHDDGQDPDHYTMEGPRWQLPLRFLTLDFYYATWYAPRFSSRPKQERVEVIVTTIVMGALIVGLILSGNFLIGCLVCWLVPARLAVFILGWSFDYLPHHGLTATPKDDKLKTTRNRIGLERLLTPLMLYQNYHLVHHLHPVIPFYRYIAVWRKNEGAYLAGDPSLSTAGGRPLTVEEYRELRKLTDPH